MPIKLTSQKERDALAKVASIRAKDPDTWTANDVKKLVKYICQRLGCLKS